jgi:hypothetical protein
LIISLIENEIKDFMPKIKDICLIIFYYICIFNIINYFFYIFIYKLIIIIFFLYGDWGWGLGIGDWGLGPIPNPQSPIPNPQSPSIYYIYISKF